MDRNIEIIKQLAKSDQKEFRIDQFEKMKIYKNEVDDLVRKGFLRIDKSQGFPNWTYFLTEYAYMLTSSDQNKKIAEKGISWQKWGVIISLIVGVSALIMAVLSYFK